MAEYIDEWGFGITQTGVRELLRRIVAEADPLQVIVFGSRARGDYRPDSDLDLAVVMDCKEGEARRCLSYSVLSGLDMTVDLLRVSKTTYDLHRPWLNSIWNYVDTEGVVLYDREHPELANPEAVYTGGEGRRIARSSAA